MTIVLNTTRSLTALLLLGAAGVLGGCHGDREDKPPRQFFPDMDDQPKWKPQEKSGFFTDGRTMRKPVVGTIPFGPNSFAVEDDNASTWAAHAAERRNDLLKAEPATFTGMSADGGEFLEKIPAPVTAEMLKLGQTKFNIYCSVCHGYLGDGQGTVGNYFAVRPANFHDIKYKEVDPNSPEPITRDGYIFTVIRNGVRTMPGYAHALNERETWSVVAYLRALQASQEGTLQDVPESQRPGVERSLREQAAAAPAAAPAAPPSPAPGTPSSPPAQSNTPASPAAGTPPAPGMPPAPSPQPAPTPPSQTPGAPK